LIFFKYMNNQRIDKLKTEGFVVLKSFFSKDEILSIKTDFDILFEPFQECTESFGGLINTSLYRKESSCVTALSPTATKALLASPIIDLCTDYFKCKPMLAEYDIRVTTIETETTLLQAHYDDDEIGLYALIYLTQSTLDCGPTFVVPRSHNITLTNNSTNYISDKTFSEHYESGDYYVLDQLEPGDALVFDLRLWHGRLPAKSGNRAIMLAKFYPCTRPEKCSNLLISTRCLRSLNQENITVLIGANTGANVKDAVGYSILPQLPRTTFGFLDLVLRKLYRQTFLLKRLILTIRGLDIVLWRRATGRNRKALFR
jgi:hypothetical protein